MQLRAERFARMNHRLGVVVEAVGVGDKRPDRVSGGISIACLVKCHQVFVVLHTIANEFEPDARKRYGDRSTDPCRSSRVFERAISVATKDINTFPRVACARRIATADRPTVVSIIVELRLDSVHIRQPLKDAVAHRCGINHVVSVSLLGTAGSSIGAGASLVTRLIPPKTVTPVGQPRAVRRPLIRARYPIHLVNHRS